MEAADEILTNQIREVIAVYRVARRADLRVPLPAVARILEQAANEAAALMPAEPLHLGAVWELAS